MQLKLHTVYVEVDSQLVCSQAKLVQLVCELLKQLVVGSRHAESAENTMIHNGSMQVVYITSEDLMSRGIPHSLERRAWTQSAIAGSGYYRLLHLFSSTAAVSITDSQLQTQTNTHTHRSGFVNVVSAINDYSNFVETKLMVSRFTIIQSETLAKN